MKISDYGWLTDENVHPDVVAYLRSKGLDVLDVKEQGWHGRSDNELLDEAYRRGRLILTHDGDFGTLAFGSAPVISVPISSSEPLSNCLPSLLVHHLPS